MRSLAAVAMNNLGSVMQAARARAADAVEAAKAVQQRVAEAAGVTDKGEDDDPVIRQHYQTEALLRRLGKHSEAYVKAMRAMCEASYALADDFEKVDVFPAIPREDATKRYKATSGWSSKASVGVERRRGVSGLKARGGRRDPPAKVLKEWRSPRQRGRMGTSV